MNLFQKNLSSVKQQIKKHKILPYLYYVRGFNKEKWFIFSLLKNIFLLITILGYEKVIKHKKGIVINLEEHIGDIVACEPVSRYIREKNKNYYIIWFTKYSYKELVAYNPNINNVFCVTCLCEWMVIKKLKLFSNVVDLHIHGRRCSAFNTTLHNSNTIGITLDNYYFFGCILESFSQAAGLSKISTAPLFHINKKIKFDCVFKNYIVIHCSSNESIRNWNDCKWKKLVSVLTKQGINVVEIGSKNVINDFIGNHNGYFNYCGNLSFQEIAYLIKKADIFIGIDSSFAHFSNALGTYGIILLGKYRAYCKYMPYSGQYMDGSNADIIQFDGNVSEIPYELVYNLVCRKMDMKSRGSNI